MNVSIARDGVEVGQYPLGELLFRAQAGEIAPDDWYWYEGMENWNVLQELLGPAAWQSATWEPAVWEPTASKPPVATRTRFRGRTLAIGGAAVILFLAGVLWIAFKPADAFIPVPPAQDPTRVDAEVRDKATSELVARLNRLPTAPAPPSYTYYDSLAISIPTAPEPLTVTITGSENVVDQKTLATTRRTDFALAADFRGGRWLFKRYRESANDFVAGTTTQMERDDHYPVPPSIASVLGIQTNTD